MSFEGFKLERMSTGEAVLRFRQGGSGPPLLLLHGYPQTHMMWGQIAGELAKDFTTGLVLADRAIYANAYGRGQTVYTCKEPYRLRAITEIERVRDAITQSHNRTSRSYE